MKADKHDKLVGIIKKRFISDEFLKRQKQARQQAIELIAQIIDAINRCDRGTTNHFEVYI